MPDTALMDTFSKDTIREAAQNFSLITHGFTDKQLEWAAVIYFRGIADGAKLARDASLERMVRAWIAQDLRPNGWVVAAKSLGVSKGDSNGAEPKCGGGAGAGASAARCGTSVSAAG